jgi:hypothetical protein
LRLFRIAAFVFRRSSKSSRSRYVDGSFGGWYAFAGRDGGGVARGIVGVSVNGVAAVAEDWMFRLRSLLELTAFPTNFYYDLSSLCPRVSDQDEANQREQKVVWRDLSWSMTSG